MKEQQAVNRVTRQHCSSLFHFTPVLPSALLPIPTVTLWDVTPSPRYYRECGPITAVFPPSPLQCRPLVVNKRRGKHKVWSHIKTWKKYFIATVNSYQQEIAYGFFARGLCRCTAVVHLSLHQLGFLVVSTVVFSVLFVGVFFFHCSPLPPISFKP